MAKQIQPSNFGGKRRKNASEIWSHFGFATDERGVIVDREKAICKHCTAELKYQNGSTSTLQYHFNNNHLKDSSPKAAGERSVQPSIAHSFGQGKDYPSTSSKHLILQKSLAEYLIENLLPFSTVSNLAFISLMKNLDPKFKVPCRRTYSDVVIPKIYADIKQRVVNLLKPTEYVACTTDGWTSIATESYITLTCHFINLEWEMKSICLQTRYHLENHTAVNFKKML